MSSGKKVPESAVHRVGRRGRKAMRKSARRLSSVPLQPLVALFKHQEKCCSARVYIAFNNVD